MERLFYKGGKNYVKEKNKTGHKHYNIRFFPQYINQFFFYRYGSGCAASSQAGTDKTAAAAKSRNKTGSKAGTAEYKTGAATAGIKTSIPAEPYSKTDAASGKAEY